MQIPKALLDGYLSFRAERFAHESERYKTLATGVQKPHTMIISCADSRVDPATIFSAGPGELFVVRNVAALIPPYEESGTYHGTSAALEFAVTGLGVSNIVVLGHGLCGGIAAALTAGEKRPVGRFIGPWVELLASERDVVIAEIGESRGELRQKTLERRAVLRSLANLSAFPFIADAVAEGRLTISGGWFSIAEGELRWLDRDTGQFELVSGQA